MNYLYIKNPKTKKNVSIYSQKGITIIFNYLKKYQQGGYIQHKLLGTDAYLDELYIKSKDIYDSLQIIYNCNDYSHACGYTIPHAGFEYSGLLAMLIIFEIQEKCTFEYLNILWFIHNIKSNQEHSYQNIFILINKINPNIKIKHHLITKNTLLSDLNIEGPVLVSTDFSHYNYKQSFVTLKQVWNIDKKNISLDLLTDEPCGKEPIRIYKDWCIKNNYKLQFNAYSSSVNPENWWDHWDNNIFNGVTYGAIAAINNNSWFNKLNSKVLSYSHLNFVNQYLLSELTYPNKLIWSPLNNIIGSSFVTISNEKDVTYSCFGSWETNENNLMNSIINASHIVKNYSWHSNQPASAVNINKYLHNKYFLSITLIAPIDTWKIINLDKLSTCPTDRGYVFYNKEINKVGMTYLPSVWNLMDTKDKFFEGLSLKHKKVYQTQPGYNLYYYESLTWKIKINI